MRGRPGPSCLARGSRSPACAALAYLAKSTTTEATRAELVPILGLSRPESVRDLSARFAALLQSESNARRTSSWH